jgi:Domain of unknown function (DUF4440)
MRFIKVSAVSLSCLALVASQASGAEPKSEPRTPEAVSAAWSAAELKGDGAFVQHLLLPDYVSVSPNGKVTSKATIVAGAYSRAHADRQPETAKVTELRAAHPYREQIKMFGDTTVVTFLSTRPDSGEPVLSCDIFVYRAGHWHAIYSQHSNG